MPVQRVYTGLGVSPCMESIALSLGIPPSWNLVPCLRVDVEQSFEMLGDMLDVESPVAVLRVNGVGAVGSEHPVDRVGNPYRLVPLALDAYLFFGDKLLELVRLRELVER